MNQPENPQSVDNSLFGRLRFVLVETSSGGNVGAAARALKNMGFSDLVLVNPRFPDVLRHEQAIAFASGAQDVLQSARIVGGIDEALQDCNYAAAVSARLREFSPPIVAPRELGVQLAGDGSLRAALVFGSERYGLPNAIVERCNVLINIPADPGYSSLNLAQAIQVLAYECRMAATAVAEDGAASARIGRDPQGSPIGFQGEAAGLAQIEGMFAHLEQALTAIEFLSPDNPRKLMPRLKRLFARTQLETEEVNILRGIARQILATRAK
ncbi:MAG TPA: RNA methyltransferase [Herbaspirillum sp.]|jgi:tRNA/rRNA methyltransferase